MLFRQNKKLMFHSRSSPLCDLISAVFCVLPEVAEETGEWEKKQAAHFTAASFSRNHLKELRRAPLGSEEKLWWKKINSLLLWEQKSKSISKYAMNYPKGVCKTSIKYISLSSLKWKVNLRNGVSQLPLTKHKKYLCLNIIFSLFLANDCIYVCMYYIYDVWVCICVNINV